MRARAALVVVAAVCAGLSACTSAVSGTGHEAAGPSISSSPTPGTLNTTLPPADPGSPPASSAPAPNPLTCPHVTYQPGRLAFTCLTNALTLPQAGESDPVWALSLGAPVEPDWQMAEGANKLATLGSRTLQQVAEGLRAKMLAAGEYGPKPGVRTLSAKATTVAGVQAYVLETALTINATYRAQSGLRVTAERLWIVALNAGDGAVATWFVTVPDDVSQLWPKVPAIIASIGLI